MRPITLDMHGFASFREPTRVDFSDADFFALVGPTGSGKTSITALAHRFYDTQEGQVLVGGQDKSAGEQRDCLGSGEVCPAPAAAGCTGRVVAYEPCDLPSPVSFRYQKRTLPQLSKLVHTHSHLGQDLVKKGRACFIAALDWNRDRTAVRRNPALMTTGLTALLKGLVGPRHDANLRPWR